MDDTKLWKHPRTLLSFETNHIRGLIVADGSWPGQKWVRCRVHAKVKSIAKSFVRRLNIGLGLEMNICLKSSNMSYYRPAFGTVFRITGGSRNNFQSHRRLSESRNKLLKGGFQEGFSKLPKCFNRRKQNHSKSRVLYIIFFSKNHRTL